MERINIARTQLEISSPALGEAMKLFEQSMKFKRSIEGLSVMQEAQVPVEAWEMEKRRERRLTELSEEFGVTDFHIHNAFQRLTWDSSAEARGFRGSADIPANMANRLGTALKYATDHISTKGGRLLDVGCGTGVTTGELLGRKLLVPKQIIGLDISPDMTAVASRKYSMCTFVASDFMSFSVEENGTFESILFCMSLHDLPSPMIALEQAVSLCSNEGRIIVTHPRGAAHVQMQNRKNPIMVRNPLPTASELDEFCSRFDTLELIHPPADAGSPKDVSEGYLAVLCIKRQI